MKENIVYGVRRREILDAVVFPMMSTSIVTAKSLTLYLSLFQEKLLYVTLSLLFFFIISHKIRSRVSYVFCNNKRGR
jgi:hypothetical protein